MSGQSAGGRPLAGLVVAVVAGDEREQEIARLAAAAGANVRAHGFTPPAAPLPGVQWCDDPATALAGAHYALFPIPGIAADGSLFAPDAPAPIVPDAALLQLLAPGAQIVLGRADAGLRAAAAATGVGLVEYEDDVELMLDRGPAVVEGVLAQVIAHTDVTIHGASVVLVGHGTIGRLLARTLVLLGAHVTVAARNGVQRADARTAGAATVDLDHLAEVLPGADVVLSTVPAAVLSAPLLALLPPGALVVDVAAPPGGVDLAAARARGLRAVWARGMGRRAPVTVGGSQWAGIVRRIEAIEERRRAG
ncbi:dipicolinate synthase subunit DpsA [Cellulomonas citrea]|uniref:dipicolinate synthase subunit DpsA n=1 Tax=Cellulomonas citrea TaxID=1909423 RepID=UPI001357B593|nr:dipicolinate synthase subunit DpsA [Cellulomonas citrea]